MSLNQNGIISSTLLQAWAASAGVDFSSYLPADHHDLQELMGWLGTMLHPTSTRLFFSIAVTVSGAQASSAIYTGTISPTINFGSGVTPQLTTGSSITED